MFILSFLMEGGRNDMTHQEGMRYMIHACLLKYSLGETHGTSLLIQNGLF